MCQLITFSKLVFALTINVFEHDGYPANFNKIFVKLKRIIYQRCLSLLGIQFSLFCPNFLNCRHIHFLKLTINMSTFFYFQVSNTQTTFTYLPFYTFSFPKNNPFVRLRFKHFTFAIIFIFSLHWPRNIMPKRRR